VLDPIDLLLERIIKGGKWAPDSERQAWTYALTYRAFVESDRESLKRIADWTDKDREYKVDPLAERIADAWADHLFGEELKVAPANESNADLLEDLLAENDLTDDCRAAERDLVVPEGEAWYRIYADRDVADVPLLEWHSRASVVPFYIGKRLLAVALVSVLEQRVRGDSKATVYRHLEIHVDGAVEHVLFRGTKQRIGETVPLDSHPETLELATSLGAGRENGARWAHGLPMLMGRVINKRGRRHSQGKSEFEGIKDFLLDLNEAVTIGAENARLTAKKRMLVPTTSPMVASALAGVELVDNGEGQLVPANGQPVVRLGDDVIFQDPIDGELGRDSTPAKVLEYSYDAEALIAHKRDLVESGLTRVGLSPAWVGVRQDAAGYAGSGTELRLRLIPTDKAGRGKARPWDAELPRAIATMQLLGAMPESEGGFGQEWTDPSEAPSIERADALPTDEVEEATIVSARVAARVMSRYQAIKREHPDWDDDAIEEELGRIDKDAPAAPALGGFPA
jgi:hypothetical protein